MTPTPEDALNLLRRIRMDLTNAQAKITDAIEAIAALPAVPSNACPICGIKPARGSTVAEHVHYSHDGPEPPEWAEAERLAGIET